MEKNWSQGCQKKKLKWKKYYNKKKNLIEKTFSNKFKKNFEIEKQNIIKNPRNNCYKKIFRKNFNKFNKSK